MRKIWTIAQREYSAMVATKAFLLSITLMPVLMFGGILVANRLKNVRDVKDKVVVLVDGSGGVLFADLEQAAEARNAALAAAAEEGAAVASLVLRRHETATVDDNVRFDLSEQVRNGQINAFAEIPAGILGGETAQQDRIVRYHGQNTVLSDERRWLERTLNETVTTRRLAEMQIDVEAVKRATAPINVAPLRLYERSADGEVGGADGGNELVGLFVPFGFLMLMFMVIFLSAQPMLESVLEEKSQCISEVLLGSASPFQLMMGKLLGNVAGSLSVVALYGLGGYAAAAYNGWDDFIPYDLAPWFLIYQVLAVMLFSSIFMAVGASVSQLKEAQAMLLPVWVLMALPMFVWLQVVREPNGSIATWMSFFPPAIPMVMVLRLASETVIPLWQILSGLVLLLATTGCGVFLAGRIFRTGILWQGKTPRLGELARWALRG